jgi:sulfonate transport system permease protein
MKIFENRTVLSRIARIVLSVTAPAAIVALWYISTAGGRGVSGILPSPLVVVSALKINIANGKLGRHLIISLERVLRGFSIGGAAGIVIGSFMGLSRTIHRILNSLVGIFRPVPMIAWIPLLILWLGIGEGSKVSVIVIGSFWPVLLNTIHGIHSVDNKLIEVGAILEKNKLQILWRIILPAAVPSIFTGIRLGMGTAWTCVVAAEMIAASRGIGYMITYARELSQPDVVLVGVFAIGLVGLLIDTGIQQLQSHLLKWNVVKK